MEIRTYQEALDYLDSFITPVIFKKIENPSFDPLERMRTLLKLLGNPEKDFKSIVVSGTSGKGSTAYFTSHILATSGYKTGLTISPHLQKVNERLQINGIEISDKEFVRMVTSMIHIIEVMKKTKVGAPSYFEILLAMAFKYFSEQKVDISIVEVGLEGKYDATNVLLPLLVVLTNISLDHTQILGDTVEKIAGEAVSAIKKLKVSQVVVSGIFQESILDIVEKRCKEKNAKLLLLGRDFGFKIKKTGLKGSIFDFMSPGKTLEDLKLTMVGKFQLENASMAVEAVLNLKKFGFKISENHIRKALKTSFFPGRFEVIRVNSSKFIAHGKNYEPSTMNHLLILDGAHNPAKMQAFIKSLKTFYPKEHKVFVVAFKEDKSIKEMLEEVMPVAGTIIFTKFSTKTEVKVKASMGMESIKYYVECIKYKKRAEAIYEEDAEKALNKALTIQQFTNSTIVVVTGSLYLVGEIRNLLK